MKLIECLEEYMEEELHDSKKYAKEAIKHKEDYPSLGETFFMLSGEELRHMQYLHNEVVKLIDAYRQQEGEPPADMLAIYNYLHNKQIEKVTEIKMLHNMYKEK